jgi:sugar phosphate isomerase/epimerase
MKQPLNRREMLGVGVVAWGAAMEAGAAAGAAGAPKAGGFRFCLNTSTIMGQKLGLVEEIEIAAKAGYVAIEPWINEIEKYVEGGGSLKDLHKRIADHGLEVASGIGFAEWIVDDPDRRKKGLETAKRDMDLLQQIGGKRLAAPPAGATEQSDLNLAAAAERYHALCEIGDSLGIVPMVEVWGFSKSLTRLGEAVLVAVESGYPKACVLADVYHLYKGGSPLAGLKLLTRTAVNHFHLNDYPGLPPATITDADRVYPGDGIAPLTELFQRLHEMGYEGSLSIELFNKEYWKQDALTVAKTALAKAIAHRS